MAFRQLEEHVDHECMDSRMVGSSRPSGLDFFWHAEDLDKSVEQIELLSIVDLKAFQG